MSKSFHTIVRMPLAVLNGRIGSAIFFEGQPLELPLKWHGTGYFIGRKSKTRSNAMAAVGLLLDFHVAATKAGILEEKDPASVLAQFGYAILHGTIVDAKCRYGLYWPARPHDGPHILKHVEKFCTFIADYLGRDPGIFADRSFGQNLKRAWISLGAQGGFLAHLRATRSAQNISDQPPSRYNDNGASGARVTPFPTELIQSMLTDGCRRDRKLSDLTLPAFVREYDIRTLLAFVLIFGGGLRSEELFHIFSHDVFLADEGTAQINLYHPERGAIYWTPPGSRTRQPTDREEYLRVRFGLTPRNLLNDRDRLFAGWKGLLLTQGAPHYYTEVFWISSFWGKLFWQLHKYYIQHLRVRALANHPYYFVSTSRSNFGEPWTMAGFQKNWQTALYRLGVSQSRLLGTNPHAGRHFYGQTAANAGIDPRIRQIMLHHRSIVSQQVYQRPTAAQVQAHIESAFQRMAAATSIEQDGSDDVVRGFNPLGLKSLISQATDLEGPHDMPFAADPLGIMNSWSFFNKMRR